jgi:excisionase family DNA binding protein
MRATWRRGSILAAASRPATQGAHDMGRRHPNHRLIKIHRTYTVEEAANALGLHKNTISRWTQQDDLTVIDKRRPKLIHGEALVQFLIKRRKKTKQPCQTGQIYCVACRAPKRPNGDMADYVRRSKGGRRNP